jgi:hypothetical protein
MLALWRALLLLGPQSPAAAFDLERKTALKVLAGLLMIAAIVQLLLLRSGVYSISGDESERALIAHGFSWSTLFEPSWWPPLTKLIMALPLRLHDDLFVTPRIEVGIAGLFCLAALAFAAYELSGSRLVALVAAGLGIFLPQRWILSVVPLSDIYGYVLVLIAAGLVARWLKTGRAGAATAASLVLMLGSAIRFEIWFIAAVWGLYLAYASLARHRLSLVRLALNGVILSAFPVYWIAHNYLATGSLDNLTIVSRQFIEYYGHDLATAIRNNVLYRFLRDIATTPALALGFAGLVYGVVSSARIRAWALVLLFPVVIEAADMMATWSVPIGEGMRSDGLWALLLLPFAAWALVIIASHIAQRNASRVAALLLLCLGLVIPLVMSTRLNLKIIEDFGPTMTPNDLSMGRTLKDLLHRDKRQVLVDATDELRYLNVMVTANAPERFVLNSDADPILAALYTDAPIDRLRHYDSAALETYRTDKFRAGDHVDLAKLQKRDIGYVLAHRPDYVAALSHDPGLRQIEHFEYWVLFAVK